MGGGRREEEGGGERRRGRRGNREGAGEGFCGVWEQHRHAPISADMCARIERASGSVLLFSSSHSFLNLS